MDGAGFVTFDVGGGCLRYKWLQAATGCRRKLEAMRLRLGASRFRVTWRTPAGLALAVGLFSSGLAALVVLAFVVNSLSAPACEAATPAQPDPEAAPSPSIRRRAP